MAPDAGPISVIIEDEDDTTRVDPETGTIETKLPDGSVVVQLDAHRPKSADEEEDPFNANLADEIDQMRLSQIANDLIDGIAADDRSRQGYLEVKARGLDLLGLQLRQPQSSVGDSASGIDGMSSVTNPLLLEACLKGWANAHAEFLPAAGPMKIRDDGEQETVQADDTADALERDMNHYLTKSAPEYYPDTSHMLLWGVYFGGSGFKRVYRCPMRRRPVSESVDAKNLIVSDTTKDLKACGRITYEFEMRPSVMKRMKLIGSYRDVPLTQPVPHTSVMDDRIAMIQGVGRKQDRPEDQPYNLYETQCEIDIPEYAKGKFKGEGIPLPYLVTMDKDSREILAIRRDWKEDDEECERKRMYVRFPYVPGPGFYGTGMLNILGNSSAAMTAAWREALDAGMFASFPAGLMSKLGTRQNTSNFRLAPGDFPAIETNGMKIGDVAMALPYKDVTPGLMTMIDKITSQTKELGSAVEIPAGEGMQNVPVGTVLAMVEQATKVMIAVHKGMHTAQGEEFDLLIDLFREHPEDFWRHNKVCAKGYWTAEKFLAALDNCNLVPVSDPNVPSHIHRVMKAVALLQLKNDPSVGPLMSAKEVLLRCLRALKEDEKGLVIDPAPQQGVPDLKGQAAMIGAEAKVQEAGVKGKKLEFDAATQATTTQTKLAEMASNEKVAETKLEQERVIHAHDAEKDAIAQQRAHGLAAGGQVLDHAKHEHDSGLEVMQTLHDMTMDHKEHDLARDQHDLAVNEANKPKPKKGD